MLGEISQTHERADSAGFHLHAVPEMVRVLETESRVGGSRDLGGGGGEGLQCQGTEFQFGMKKNIQRGKMLPASQCECFRCH